MECVRVAENAQFRTVRPTAGCQREVLGREVQYEPRRGTFGLPLDACRTRFVPAALGPNRPYRTRPS